MTLRITLIHGTFARGAQWVQPGSNLRRTLEQELGAAIAFEEPLLWTGGNRIPDRLRAADELARRIATRATQFPADRHVLIGHSHGGSVAAYGLERHPEILPSIAGVGFLATPFIDVRPRPGWEREVPALCLGSGAILWLVLTLATLYPLSDWFFRHDAEDVGGLVQLGGLIALAIVLGWLSWRVSKRLIAAIRPRQDELAARLATSVLPAGPSYLFTRAPGDEAAGVLSVTQMLVWPVAGIMDLMSAFFAWMTETGIRAWRSGWRGRSLLAGGAALLLYGIIFIFIGVTFFAEPTVYGVLAAPFDGSVSASFEVLPGAVNTVFNLGVRAAAVLALGSAALITLLFAIWVVSVGLVAVSCFAFGTSLWFAGPFVQLSVEPLPQGSWTLHRLPWPKPEPGGHGAMLPQLSHSEPYSTMEGEHVLCGWLRGLTDTADRLTVS